MIVIAQGATPYINMEIEGHDLSGAFVVVTVKGQNVKMNFFSADNRVTVTSDGTDSEITVHMTQEETLKLPSGTAQVQARWKKNGEAYTSETETIEVGASLYKGVI